MADDEYEFDPWELASGLPDNLTVKVDNPHFGFDAGMQDGQACLFFLDGKVTAGGDGDISELNQWYTTGPGWESADKGQRIVRDDGKRNVKLSKQSNYGRLVASLMRCADDQGLTDIMRKRGNPYEAALWQGLEVHLIRREFSWTDRETGERRESSRLEVDHITDPAGTTRSTGRPAASPPAPSGDLSPMVKVSLRKLAAKVKGAGQSHNQFAEQAFSDIDGVLDNPVAEDAVMDSGPGSIWAEAGE